MAKANETKVNATQPAARTQVPIKWNITNMQNSYANFCNANSTREEVVLNFGMNKSWDRGASSKEGLDIELNHRIVLSPFAAKRLSALLQQLMKEYESRYGTPSE